MGLDGHQIHIRGITFLYYSLKKLYALPLGSSVTFFFLPALLLSVLGSRLPFSPLNA